MAIDSFILQILPELLRGLVITFELTLLGLIIGFFLGLSAALAKAYGNRPLRYVATLYTEVIRGSPLLAQLFIIYYGLPAAGVVFDRFTAAYIALAINSGAYQSEIFRGAIQAVSSGQVEAARSMGMSKIQAIGHVVLPQALRLSIPPFSNETVYVLKGTSIVFLVAVLDLFGTGRVIIGQTLKPLETYLIIALIYIVIVFGLSRLFAFVEKKYRIPGSIT